ncbi:MAG: hypothetical protein COW71_13370 [Ignavibacteriales bacterium CG18_big_fil_WC_8_21_14_2_50_31_20]|nr:MAG: hypothetical protein COW71_13370 [Ignavibacteriales bacterium CG18_big_fil_WC_8_21_14_2_50_31_20]
MKTMLKILMLVMFVGCGSVNRHNYDIEIDGSETISAIVFEKYVNIIVSDVVMNLGRYDCISIKFVDECSLSKSERVFSLDLAKMDFSNGRDGLNFAEDSSKARMKRFIEVTVSDSLKNILYNKRDERKTCSGYTNIIDALNQSASLLNNRKSYSSDLEQFSNDAVGNDNYEYENVILLFSDMVNENRERTMNFTEFGTLTQEQIIKKLEVIKKEGKIPNLNNAKVVVYGATSTNVSDRYANKQIENVKLFWQSFFKKSGAELLAYGYDTEKEIIDYISEQNQ